MTTDTIVQIALAISLGLLSLVGTGLGWLMGTAFKKLMHKLDVFDKFMGAAREHEVLIEEKVTHHKERLDHHQRWLEEHEKRLSEDRMGGCAMRGEGR